MTKLKNKFAIGCLVQWYEIDLIGEYIESLKQSLNHIENKENVYIDFVFTVNQDLERIDDRKSWCNDLEGIEKNICLMLKKVLNLSGIYRDCQLISVDLSEKLKKVYLDVKRRE